MLVPEHYITDLNTRYGNPLIRDMRNVDQSKFPYSLEESFQKRFHHYAKSAEFMLQNWSSSLGKEKTKVLQDEILPFLSLDDVNTAKKLKQNTYRLLSAIAKHTDKSVKELSVYLDIAESLYTWDTRKKQTTCTISTITAAGKTLTYIQINEPIHNLTKDQVEEYLKIYTAASSEWFKELPEFAQEYFKAKFSDFKSFAGKSLNQSTIDDFNKLAATIPSNLRYNPGVANFMKHTCEIYDVDGNLISSSSSFSSSTPAPIKVKDRATQKQLTLQNIEQYATQLQPKQPLLVQSLLSPLFGDTIWQKFTSENTTLYTELNEDAVTELERSKKRTGSVLYTILPINNFRKYPISRNNDNKKLTAIVKLIKLFLEHENLTLANKFPAHFFDVINIDSFKVGDKNAHLLTRLVTECSKISKGLKQQLESAVNPAEKKTISDQILLYQSLIALIELNAAGKYKDFNRDENMFRSTLELILMDKLGGIGATSCKSGKDRAGLVELLFDVIGVYFYIYGEIPRPDDFKNHPEKRRHYVDIFSDLFLANHYPALSAANSPHSFGLKSIKGILPKDILKAITKKCPGCLAAHHALAALNKVTTKKVFFDNTHIAKIKSKKSTIKTTKTVPTSGTTSETLSKLKTNEIAHDPEVKPAPSPDIKTVNPTQTSLASKEIKVSYDKQNKCYMLTGILSELENSIQKVARDLTLTAIPKKDGDDIVYTFYRNGVPISNSEKKNVVSELCVDLKNRNQCDIQFDPTKKELTDIKKNYDTEVISMPSEISAYPHP